MPGEMAQTTAGKGPSRMPQRTPSARIKFSSVTSPAWGYGGGGHASWHCRTCDAVVYGPPLNTHCTALEGPASVRISTRSGGCSMTLLSKGNRRPGDGAAR